ncbi:aldehyde dehydrogenase family protein [Streptomyces chartreusis]
MTYPAEGIAIADPASRMTRQISAAHAAFASGRTKSLAWRRGQLHALIRMLDESAPLIQRAMAADLGKNAVEAYLTEVAAVADETKLAMRKLRRWTKARRVPSMARLGPTSARIHREPLGTVLIIGPWNYPFHLTLVPLVGALAAGNTAVLKPSEIAPASSRLIAELVQRYLDPEAVQVVEGGVAETTQLLAHRFDHVFYTGNGQVGSIVMQAAAKHLTPVTLELGGKSPTWIDDSFPLAKTARTLAWGKFSNCGQTCVAPDYVLTTPNLAPRLAKEITRAITHYYGDDPGKSPDYGRIVNERHTQRLADLLPGGTAITGGSFDIADRYIAPTVLIDVDLDSAVMRDEIFGPILPIVTVRDHHEAIAFINQRPKPLALYAFTNRAEVRHALLQDTSAGGTAFNTVMLQLGVSTLPFGGVGHSGMGAYHGEHSIRTFSHERAVLRKLPGPDLSAFARPPFTKRKAKLLTSR